MSTRRTAKFLLLHLMKLSLWKKDKQRNGDMECFLLMYVNEIILRWKSGGESHVCSEVFRAPTIGLKSRFYSYFDY